MIKFVIWRVKVDWVLAAYLLSRAIGVRAVKHFGELQYCTVRWGNEQNGEIGHKINPYTAEIWCVG